MPNFKATNRQKIDDGTKDGNWIEQGLIKSTLKVMTDEFTGTVAVGLTVGIASPPKGAIIHLVAFNTEGLGASCDMSVGDENDLTRYSDPITMDGRQSHVRIIPTGSQYKLGQAEGDDQLLMQCAGAEANGTFKVTIFYTN